MCISNQSSQHKKERERNPNIAGAVSLDHHRSSYQENDLSKKEDITIKKMIDQGTHRLFDYRQRTIHSSEREIKSNLSRFS